MTQQDGQARGALPLILIAAVLQGWALYALHMSIKGHHWPASNAAWLGSLYALAAIAPLTVQLLARGMRGLDTWLIVAGLSAVFAYFGWHHGSHVIGHVREEWDFVEAWFPLAFVSAVLWLLVLPFVQVRIEHGHWSAPYRDLFAHAWNNKLVLFEAAVFTGLFWLLLGLWQQLFAMLGVRFFRDLFSEPIFVYPVTSITFGIALHLIGSLERFTQVVLQQVLNVLKWLAIVAGILLTLFSITLLTKLPGMIATGERAISAAWLLWLMAVTVLLVNAAYRDGANERPYPRPIAFALRLAIPLMLIAALTAVYALYLRIENFGLTVDRVWACVVAAMACFYSIGYALAARRSSPWLGGIGRVNVAVALVLIGVIALTLTPVMSPYRIAAASQLSQVMAQSTDAVKARRDDALRYLRFSTGDYGMKRLQALTTLQGHPQAAEIRADAKAMLDRQHRYDRGVVPSTVEHALADMRVSPKGRALDSNLAAAVKKDLASDAYRWMLSREGPLLGVFIDLNEDGAEEFVVVAQTSARVFSQQGEQWSAITGMRASKGVTADAQAKALERGDVSSVQPQWRELRIGTQKFRATP